MLIVSFTDNVEVGRVMEHKVGRHESMFPRCDIIAFNPLDGTDG